MNSAARKTLALDQRERVTIYTAESPCRSVVFFDTPHEITVLVPLGYAETMYVHVCFDAAKPIGPSKPRR